jgi:hypothetical protein
MSGWRRGHAHLVAQCLGRGSPHLSKQPMTGEGCGHTYLAARWFWYSSNVFLNKTLETRSSVTLNWFKGIWTESLILWQMILKKTMSVSGTNILDSRPASRTTLLLPLELTAANSAPLSTGKKGANHSPLTPRDKQSKDIWSGDFHCSPIIESNTCNRGHFSVSDLRFGFLP